jgi:hypothetical protein
MNLPITPETEIKLRFATEGSLKDFYPVLDDRYKQINQIKISLDFLCSQFGIDIASDECIKLLNLKRLIEYNMLITLFHLDLSVIVNLFLNGKSDYEKLFALKQGMVIINEGYKKIFNFVTENKDGSPNFTQRDNSFWNKDIRNIVEMYPNLEPEFKLITKQLDEYFEISFDKIKEIRNLTVHYHSDPVEFYQMLKSLDTKTIFVKLTGFVNIISRMYPFMTLIINEMNTDINNGREKTRKSINTTFSMIDDLLNSKAGIDDSFKTEIKEKMKSMKKMLDI